MGLRAHPSPPVPPARWRLRTGCCVAGTRRVGPASLLRPCAPGGGWGGGGLSGLGRAGAHRPAPDRPGQLPRAALRLPAGAFAASASERASRPRPEAPLARSAWMPVPAPRSCRDGVALLPVERGVAVRARCADCCLRKPFAATSANLTLNPASSVAGVLDVAFNRFLPLSGTLSRVLVSDVPRSWFLCGLSVSVLALGGARTPHSVSVLIPGHASASARWAPSAAPLEPPPAGAP